MKKWKRLLGTIALSLGLLFAVGGSNNANAASWHEGTPKFLHKRYKMKSKIGWRLHATNKKFSMKTVQNEVKGYHPIWKYKNHIYTVRSTTYWIKPNGRKAVSQYVYAKIKRINSRKIFLELTETEKINENPVYFHFDRHYYYRY